MDMITLSGGLGAAEAPHATVGNDTINIQPGEAMDCFHSRVMGIARDAGERFAVFGGLPETRLPTMEEMTDEDRAGIARIIAQAEGLADLILGSGVPDKWHVRALQGLQNLAKGSGLYVLPPRCDAALNRSLGV